MGFAGAIISTIYEVVCIKLDMDVSETTAAMSLYSNGKYLFTFKQKKDNKLQCLYGLRALALIWLMLGYRFILPLVVPLINPVDFVLDVSFIRGYSKIMSPFRGILITSESEVTLLYKGVSENFSRMGFKFFLHG